MKKKGPERIAVSMLGANEVCAICAVNGETLYFDLDPGRPGDKKDRPAETILYVTRGSKMHNPNPFFSRKKLSQFLIYALRIGVVSKEVLPELLVTFAGLSLPEDEQDACSRAIEMTTPAWSGIDDPVKVLLSQTAPDSDCANWTTFFEGMTSQVRVRTSVASARPSKHKSMSPTPPKKKVGHG